MSVTVESSFFQFVLNPESSSWSLYGARLEDPSLEGVWMRIGYRMGPSSLWRTGRRRFKFLEKWFKPRISGINDVPSPHGNLKQVSVEMGPDVNGISYSLEFALPEQHPLFLWRLKLENGGPRSVAVEDLEMLRVGFFPGRRVLPSPGPLSALYRPKPVGYGSVRPNPKPGELGFYSNGWQSWSYTGTYGPEDAYRASQLGIFAEMMWYSGGKSPKRKSGYFTSDMFGVIGDRTYRTGILAGFLSQVQHFGSLEVNIADPLYPAMRLWVDGDRARLDPGAAITTDWAVIQYIDVDNPDPLAPYLEAVAREHQLPPPGHRTTPSTGWCSWYYFFGDIDESKIRANLASAAELQESIPLNLIQIDDGFESQIGDWLTFNSGFPEGVAPLAGEIKDAGFTPGLWLAPFITHSRSNIARKHRNWLLHNRPGLPVNAGFLWKNFTRALDLTCPGAREYVREVIHTAVHTWGYAYLKLDFLYAAALKGRHLDRTKTRAQVLRGGLELIRETAGPEMILVGCGVPLGPAIGIFDAVRIGTDVDPSWGTSLFKPKVLFRAEPNLPSTRNALQNILTRAPLHKRWWVNDPDCLLIRPDSEMTLAEVQSLATAIAMTGSSVLLSDDLSKLPAERLRIASQLVPLISERPRVIDWFDAATPRLLRLDLSNQTGEWYLLVVFNWDGDGKEVSLPLEKFGLPSGDYTAREFWSGYITRISGNMLALPEVPRHGVGLVSLRPVVFNQAVYVGSDLHISQGLEVVEWAVSSSNKIRARLERLGSAHGVFDLYLPTPPQKVAISQGEVRWRSLSDQLYRFRVSFQRCASIEIT